MAHLGLPAPHCSTTARRPAESRVSVILGHVPRPHSAPGGPAPSDRAGLSGLLFHDYRTNVTSYPKWQAYLRDVQPPTLVVWGQHDPSFTVAGAVAYGEDVPGAEVHLLDAGHFALDEAAPQIAELIRRFFAVRATEAPGRP